MVCWTLKQSIHQSISDVLQARKDARQLGDDNTALQKQLHGAQREARDMVALLYERSTGKEGGCSVELTEMLNAPDSELPLDQLLHCLTALLRQS